MAPVTTEKREPRPRTRSTVAAAGRFRPSLRYLLSAWHLNQRVDNSPFSFLQEQELCKMAHNRNLDGTQLSYSAFRVLAYRFAARLNRASTGHLQAWRNRGGCAGEKWLRSFLTRNPGVRSVLSANTTDSSAAQGSDPGSFLELRPDKAANQRQGKQQHPKMATMSLAGVEDKSDIHRTKATDTRSTFAEQTKQIAKTVVDQKRAAFTAAKLQLVVVQLNKTRGPVREIRRSI